MEVEKMKKKFKVIFFCMLMMTNILITALVKNDFVVSASPNIQKSDIDYYFILNVITKLSKIIFDPINGVDHGIYKGRNFGTTGEQYAAQWF